MSATASSQWSYDSNDSPRIYTVTDTVGIFGIPFEPSFIDCGWGPTGLTACYNSSPAYFKWYSLTDLPGSPSTFFPKIYGGADGGTNTWQTLSTLEAMPGIVSVQNVAEVDPDLLANPLIWFLPFPDPSPILGEINFFNALTWSVDPDSTSRVAVGSSAQTVESATLASSLTLEAEGVVLGEVRLVSSVRPAGNGYSFRYRFENLTDETLTIAWDSAGLVRTLDAGEVVTVLRRGRSGAIESQGYAHVDGESLSGEMVSMSLVPAQVVPFKLVERRRGAIRARP